MCVKKTTEGSNRKEDCVTIMKTVMQRGVVVWENLRKI